MQAPSDPKEGKPIAHRKKGKARDWKTEGICPFGGTTTGGPALTWIRKVPAEGIWGKGGKETQRKGSQRRGLRIELGQTARCCGGSATCWPRQKESRGGKGEENLKFLKLRPGVSTRNYKGEVGLKPRVQG